MLDRFKDHYLRIGPRRFVGSAIVILVILDIFNTIYLRLYWLKKDLASTLVRQSIARSQLGMSDFSTQTIDEMTGLINNTFYFFLFLILANNFFFYFFYLKKKLWAQGYVLFYTLTAAIFSVSFIVDKAGLGWKWDIYNFSTIVIYAYLYVGIKLLKQETTIIPARGRRGR